MCVCVCVCERERENTSPPQGNTPLALLLPRPFFLHLSFFFFSFCHTWSLILSDHIKGPLEPIISTPPPHSLLLLGWTRLFALTLSFLLLFFFIFPSRLALACPQIMNKLQEKQEKKKKTKNQPKYLTGSSLQAAALI